MVMSDTDVFNIKLTMNKDYGYLRKEAVFNETKLE